MKRFFTQLSVLMVLSTILGFSQNTIWTSNLTGNTTLNDARDTDGIITISSELQSVSGGSASMIKYNNQNDYNAVDLSFSSVPVANRFRARAGVPFTINVATRKKRQSTSETFDRILIKTAIGQNEQPYRYDTADQTGVSGSVTNAGPPTIEQSFAINHTFARGRTEAWITLVVEEFYLERTGSGFNFEFEFFTYSTTIVIPFVVEGPSEPFTEILGTTTQPKIPYMVLHQPPGSQSSASISSTQKTCRSYEETYQKDVTDTKRGSIKIGYKGTIGIGYSFDSEFFVRFNGGQTNNDLAISTKSNETCIQFNNTISTVALATANNAGTNGDLFIGYGVDMDYAIARGVSVVNNIIIVDTSLIYAPKEETIKKFVKTKAAILQDIQVETLKLNDATLSIKERENAKNQIDAWNKTLQLNEDNIALASAPPATRKDRVEFQKGSNDNYSEGVDYTVSKSIETSKYLEREVGFDFLIEVMGSGYSGGYTLTTKSTFGQRTASSITNGTVLSYSFQDNGDDDSFIVDVFRDPMFGSHVFKVVDGSRSSCPFEPGTYQLDKPRIELIGTSGDQVNLSNVNIDASANFQIKLWNDSNYDRAYQLSFANNPADLLITAQGSNGAQNLNSPITLGRSSGSNNYTINVKRPNSTSVTTVSNLKLVLAPSCDPSIGDTISISVNWSVPPPPTSVTVTKSRLCSAEAVSLSANCFIGNLSWWDNPTPGLGNKLNGISPTFTPSGTVTYYASCDGTNYLGQRIAAPTVTIAEQGINLTFSGVTAADKFAVASNTIRAENIINSPTNVLYRAGKSITLDQGFEANTGTVFQAEIGECENFSVPGLVAYYSFSGNANDESGNNHNGIINGATLTTDKFGAAQKALSFDGNNDFVRIPNLYNATTQPLNNVTYSLWFKPNQNYGAADFYSLIIRTTDGGFTDMIGKPSFGSAENDKFQFFMFDNNLNFTKATTNNFVANQWYHVVATRANGTTKIYLNAIKEGEATYANSSYFYPDLYLGGHQTANRWFFNGALDDLRIYNRALSDAEIQAIYNAEKL